MPGVFFHARGATEEQLLDAVAAYNGLSTPAGLDGLLDDLLRQEPDATVALVVDALDEGADRRVIARTLTELAIIPWLRIVVGTRPMAAADRYARGLLPDLEVTSADAENLVDLDADPYRDPEGLRAFAAALLQQEGTALPGPVGGAWERYRTEDGLRDSLAALIAHRAGCNFLVAALTAAVLATQDNILDPRAPGSDPAALPATIGEALDKYLDNLPDRDKARTRGLLTAVAYARGSGIDDRTWLRFAAALGYSVERADLDVLRDTSAADYLLQTANEPVGPIVRLFHQALTDQLLSRHSRTDARAVLDTLLAETRTSGGWANATPYVQARITEHASDAEALPTLLDDPEFLAHADLARLRAVLADLIPSQRPPAAAVVLRAGPEADALPPAQRMGLLALTAAHLGLPYLKDRLLTGAPLQLRPCWAHSWGQPHQQLIGHTAGVEAMAMGRLGGRDVIVSAGGSDKTVRIWDEHGTPVGEPLTSHTGDVNAVAMGRLGGRDVIVSAGRDYTGQDHTVRVWDEHGAPVGEPLTGHRDRVNAVAVGRLGRRDVIVSAGYDDTRVWSEHGAQVGEPLTGHTGNVHAVAIGRLDGRDVIVAGGGDSWDHPVRVWDEHGTPIRQPLSRSNCDSYAVAVGRLSGRDVIVSGGGFGLDTTVRVWDERGAVGEPLTGHTSEVRAVAVGRLSDRDVIISGGFFGAVRVWDERGAPVGEPLTGHRGRVNAVAVGRLGRRDVIVSAGEDSVVRVWDEPDIPVGRLLTSDTLQVHAVAAGRLGGRDVIVSGGYDKTVHVWDEHGAPVGEPLTGHTGAVNAVAVGRFGGQHVIVSGGEDYVVRVWDERGAPVGQPLRGDTSIGRVFAVAAGRLGRRDVIVAGGDYNTVWVWDKHGTPVALTGHTYQVNAVAVGRVGGRDVIVSGSTDGTVRVWDQHGAPVGGPLTYRLNQVLAVAVGRLGDRDVIISGELFGAVRVWDEHGAPVGEPLAGQTPAT